jgi:predicted membrane protein
MENKEPISKKKKIILAVISILTTSFLIYIAWVKLPEEQFVFALLGGIIFLWILEVILKKMGKY